LQYNCT